MPRARLAVSLAPVALAAALLPAACAEVVVDTGALGFCLEWKDGGPGAVTELPADLACTVAAPFSSDPDASVLPPPGVSYDLVYVCVPAEGGACPAGAVMEARVGACAGWEQGEACPSNQPKDGTFVTGCCQTGSVRAYCGPDPAAEGGCCYYAVVTDTVFCT